MIKYILVFSVSVMLISGCSDNFLDIKPDQAMVVPENIKDFQAILDNTVWMNESNVPFLGEVSADDIFLDVVDWQTLTSEDERNAYVWNEVIFGGMETSIVHWNRPYLSILYANITIEGLSKLEHSAERDKLLGSALFFRAWNHFLLVNNFSRQYESDNSGNELGIPLRLNSDINLLSHRGTVQIVYDQILEDLTRALDLLPSIQSIKTRPSKWSTHALLSKIFLQIGKYEAALEHAEETLKIGSELMDYNRITKTLEYSFEPMNKEVIFYTFFYGQPFNPARFQVAQSLYELYDDHDLRKTLFFTDVQDRVKFVGSYTGGRELFAGLAVDEVYFIKIESLARMGRGIEALDSLNEFLKMRHSVQFFEPLHLEDPDEILHAILTERRKQLVFRGIRWMDLKRLNVERRFESILERRVNDRVYVLQPRSPRYVLPLPNDVVMIGGLEQNPR